MKKKLQLWTVLLLSISSFSQLLIAQETTPKVFASDCTDVQLDPIDPAKLTKEERIKLLEASLFDSIDRTTDCMRKAQDSMTKTMAKGLNSGANSGSNSGASANANANGESQNQQSEQQNESNAETDTQVTGNNTGSENQGIAEQDNDKLICMALKQDVDNEQDPQKKAKLAEELKSYSMCNKYFR